MFYPLRFEPIFKERIWGGRRMQELFGKALPAGGAIGESWEITDRPEGVSVVINGELKGRDLRWLMENHGKEIMGNAAALNGRFPLLVKILDAQSKLSLQVHPPADKAQSLQGEPKTEMWYIADAAPDADLFVGLKAGVTREEFEQRTADGSIEQCFQRIVVKPGDSMFLPSGRVHAIGAGNMIFEIQQNSDTTYRVFDWDRVGQDGKPRELHVAESLESIDFEDFEPGLVDSPTTDLGALRVTSLVRDPLFNVDLIESPEAAEHSFRIESPMVIAVASGELEVTAGGMPEKLVSGEFALVPAACESVDLASSVGCRFLKSTPGA